MLKRQLVSLIRPLCSGIGASVGLACLVFCTSAFALKIKPGVRAFVSPNAEWVVRIGDESKASQNAVWFRFADDAYRPVARARLVNAVGPELAYVTNNGDLLTIGDLSGGTAELALVAYTSNGKHLKTTPQGEIFTDREIACVARGAEGIDWLPSWGGVEVRPDKNAVQIEDILGGTIIIRMETGNAEVYAARRLDGMRRRKCAS